MTTFTEFFSQISEIKESLRPGNNFKQVFKAGGGEGSSGSFFFFSHDKKYIIKTMSKYELKLFLSMFDDYCTHFKENR